MLSQPPAPPFRGTEGLRPSDSPRSRRFFCQPHCIFDSYPKQGLTKDMGKSHIASQTGISTQLLRGNPPFHGQTGVSDTAHRPVFGYLCCALRGPRFLPPHNAAHCEDPGASAGRVETRLLRGRCPSCDQWRRCSVMFVQGRLMKRKKPRRDDEAVKEKVSCIQPTFFILCFPETDYLLAIFSATLSIAS